MLRSPSNRILSWSNLLVILRNDRWSTPRPTLYVLNWLGASKLSTWCWRHKLKHYLRMCFHELHYLFPFFLVFQFFNLDRCIFYHRRTIKELFHLGDMSTWAMFFFSFDVYTDKAAMLRARGLVVGRFWGFSLKTFILDVLNDIIGLVDVNYLAFVLHGSRRLVVIIIHKHCKSTISGRSLGKLKALLLWPVLVIDYIRMARNRTSRKLYRLIF